MKFGRFGHVILLNFLPLLLYLVIGIFFHLYIHKDDSIITNAKNGFLTNSLLLDCLILAYFGAVFMYMMASFVYYQVCDAYIVVRIHFVHIFSFLSTFSFVIIGHHTSEVKESKMTIFCCLT